MFALSKKIAIVSFLIIASDARGLLNREMTEISNFGLRRNILDGSIATGVGLLTFIGNLALINQRQFSQERLLFYSFNLLIDSICFGAGCKILYGAHRQYLASLNRLNVI